MDRIGTRASPCGAGIIGTPDAVVVRTLLWRPAFEQFLTPLFFRHVGRIGVFDGGVDRVGLGRRDREAYPAEHTARQTALELGPVTAAVRGLVDAAAGPRFVEGPRPAHLVVTRSIQYVGIPGVHHHINNSDVFAVISHTQDLAPAPSAVCGLVQATVFALGIQGNEHGHIHDVGVGGMDHDTTDVMRFLETHIVPGLSCIRRLVDAIPPVGVA